MTPFITAGIVLSLASSPSQDRLEAQSNSPSALADAVLIALVSAGSARDVLQAVRLKNDPYADAYETMTAKRQATRRVQEGRDLLAPFLRAKEERIRETAESLDEVMKALQAVWLVGLKLDEELLLVKSEAQMAALIAKASKEGADADEAWRTLPMTIAMLTHVLTDSSRLENGKLRYLRITAAEQKALIGDIRRFFPTAKAKLGGHPVEVSANLLRKFLESGWKPSDEKNP